MVDSYYRGYKIIYLNGKWIYSDTEEAVSSNARRSCGNCGKHETAEGHDGCLGSLPGIMNACCGHGKLSKMYIQFWDGTRIRGGIANIVIKRKLMLVLKGIAEIKPIPGKKSKETER